MWKISVIDLSNVGYSTLFYIKIVTKIKSTNILMQRMLFCLQCRPIYGKWLVDDHIVDVNVVIIFPTAAPRFVS